MEKKLRFIQSEMDTIIKKAAIAAIASYKRGEILEKKSQLLNENAEDEHYFSIEYKKLGSYIFERAMLLEKSIAAVANDVVSKSSAVLSNNERNANASNNKVKRTIKVNSQWYQLQVIKLKILSKHWIKKL